MTYITALLQLHDTLLQAYLAPSQTAAQILRREAGQPELPERIQKTAEDPVRQLLQMLRAEAAAHREIEKSGETAGLPADSSVLSGFGAGAQQTAPGWPDMETISRFFERDARRYGQ